MCERQGVGRLEGKQRDDWETISEGAVNTEVDEDIAFVSPTWQRLSPGTLLSTPSLTNLE